MEDVASMKESPSSSNVLVPASAVNCGSAGQGDARHAKQKSTYSIISVRRSNVRVNLVAGTNTSAADHQIFAVEPRPDLRRAAMVKDLGQPLRRRSLDGVDHLARGPCKAPAGLAGGRRFVGCVERQRVGLRRDAVDPSAPPPILSAVTAPLAPQRRSPGPDAWPIGQLTLARGACGGLERPMARG